MSEQFSKPPLQEAVFELRFQDDLDLTVPGFLYEKFKEEFPIRRSGILQSGRIQPLQNEKITHQIVTLPRVQFFSEDNTRFISASSESISFHNLNPYIGWSNFSRIISTLFDSIKSTAGTARIKRAGLRFINHIDIAKQELNQEVKLNKYFTLYIHLPSNSAFPSSATNLSLSIVYEESNKNFCRIQLTSLAHEPEKQPFLLDFDFFNDTVCDINDFNAIQWANEAHDIIESRFLAALTETTLNLFR